MNAATDRAVPAHARELAARLSALFQRDVEIVKQLNDAHHRLDNANERLFSGLAPDAFGVLSDDAAAGAITTSPIAALIRDGGPTANSAMLEALQQTRWTIHRAFCRYQSACEERRQLAVGVGELSHQLTDALCAAGWSAPQTRQANVHELASGCPSAARSASRYGAGVIQGTLRAYYFQLRLSIEDYEFPHFNTGRDGNALACQVVVEDTEIGDSYLRHRPTLYTFELASFTERLRVLARKDSGQAVLGDADAESGDEFGLTISLTDGTGTLAGFLGNQAGARLGFGPIDIDRSFLADALALFDDIIDTFPVRGDITAD